MKIGRENWWLYYFTLRNVIEEFCWIESNKLSNKFLFVHIFWLSQVIHKKTRMWCYCQLTILLWRSQQSMYHCGARCKDICLVSCRRRQKNWGIYVFVQFSLNPSNRSGLQMENLRVCLSVCHHFGILNIGPLYHPTGRIALDPIFIYCWAGHDVS